MKKIEYLMFALVFVIFAIGVPDHASAGGWAGSFSGSRGGSYGHSGGYYGHGGGYYGRGGAYYGHSGAYYGHGGGYYGHGGYWGGYWGHGYGGYYVMAASLLELAGGRGGVGGIRMLIHIIILIPTMIHRPW